MEAVLCQREARADPANFVSKRTQSCSRRIKAAFHKTQTDMPCSLGLFNQRSSPSLPRVVLGRRQSSVRDELRSIERDQAAKPLVRFDQHLNREITSCRYNSLSIINASSLQLRFNWNDLWR